MYLRLKYFIYISLILFSANSCCACGDESEQSKPDEELYSSSGISLADAKKFMRLVKDAVNRNDRYLVADLFNCNKAIPCSWVRKRGATRPKRVETTSAAHFLKHYDEIINEDLKYILNHEYAIQRMWIHMLYGFTMCNGCVWFWSHGAIEVVNRLHNCKDPRRSCNY